MVCCRIVRSFDEALWNAFLQCFVMIIFPLYIIWMLHEVILFCLLLFDCLACLNIETCLFQIFLLHFYAFCWWAFSSFAAMLIRTLLLCGFKLCFCDVLHFSAILFCTFQRYCFLISCCAVFRFCNAPFYNSGLHFAIALNSSLLPQYPDFCYHRHVGHFHSSAKVSELISWRSDTSVA